MIAIDTNMLLRYLLEDDPEQAARSAKPILGRQPVLVTDGVKGKTADFPDALILNKAKALAASAQPTFRGLDTFDSAAQALPGAKSPYPQDATGTGGTPA